MIKEHKPGWIIPSNHGETKFRGANSMWPLKNKTIIHMKSYKEKVAVAALSFLLVLNLIYIYKDAITIFYGVERLRINLSYFNLLYFGIRVLPVIIFFHIFKRTLKISMNMAILYSLLTYMVFYMFVLFAERTRKLASYKEYGQMIIPAIVFDKAASSRGGDAGLYVYYHYKGIKETTRVGMSNKKQSFNSIHKGDTVLIMYAVEYRHWNHLYRLHPTPDELNRCRHGCFYFNGQIQDTIPRLPDDPFKVRW